MKKIFSLLAIGISSAFYGLYGSGGEVRLAFEEYEKDLSLNKSLGFFLLLDSKDIDMLIQYVNDSHDEGRRSDWLVDCFKTVADQPEEKFFCCHTYEEIKDVIKNTADIALLLLITIKQKTPLAWWILKEYDFINILKVIFGEEKSLKNAHLFAWLEVIKKHTNEFQNIHEETKAVEEIDLYEPYNVLFKNGILTDVLIKNLDDAWDKLFHKKPEILNITNLTLGEAFE